MTKNGNIVLLTDVLLRKFRGLETLVTKKAHQGFFSLCHMVVFYKFWLTYVRDELNSFTQVQELAHVNCLDPSSALPQMEGGKGLVSLQTIMEDELHLCSSFHS